MRQDTFKPKRSVVFLAGVFTGLAASGAVMICVVFLLPKWKDRKFQRDLTRVVQKQHDEAQERIENGTASVEDFRKMATWYEVCGSREKALEYAEAAVERFPSYLDAYDLLADTYSFRGEPKKAMEALERYPLKERWWYHKLKADYLEKFRDFQGAIRANRQAINLLEEYRVHTLRTIARYDDEISSYPKKAGQLKFLKGEAESRITEYEDEIGKLMLNEDLLEILSVHGGPPR